jgi:hypothetical protein
VDFETFIEDKSTNGCFVNGVRVGKGITMALNDGCEISFGDKFTSQNFPKIKDFIGIYI